VVGRCPTKGSDEINFACRQPRCLATLGMIWPHLRAHEICHVRLTARPASGTVAGCDRADASNRQAMATARDPLVSPGSPFLAHSASPIELKAQQEAARGGRPFLLYRDDANSQRIVVLGEDDQSLTIGRRESNDIALAWDEQVSRVHAQIERVADDWTVADAGLSSNGSYLNGVRIGARRRLRDGDQLRFGETIVIYRAPGDGDAGPTVVPDADTTPQLSASQRRVLAALCRPYAGASPFPTPAKNKEIATELSLSVEAVKSTLRVLFQKFGVEQFPQNEKRIRLVERAFQTGLLTSSTLDEL
jgi:pSer/pThr/pTyr-binding forkhead associated (FHA) protein